MPHTVFIHVTCTQCGGKFQVSTHTNDDTLPASFVGGLDIVPASVCSQVVDRVVQCPLCSAMYHTVVEIVQRKTISIKEIVYADNEDDQETAVEEEYRPEDQDDDQDDDQFEDRGKRGKDVRKRLSPVPSGECEADRRRIVAFLNDGDFFVRQIDVALGLYNKGENYAQNRVDDLRKDGRIVQISRGKYRSVARHRRLVADAKNKK